MSRARLAVLAPGIALAAAVAWGLAGALPLVKNRHAFVYDAARRAILDVEAADALRSFSPLRYLFYLAGPETWPTLRLAIAAPLHALAGPHSALEVELAVSTGFTAALFVALAFAAHAVSPASVLRAVLIFGIGAGLLLGNPMLLLLSTDGMLDVPSAVLTLATAAAWLAARDHPERARPWALAVCGNLLFHMRWQLGMSLALTVVVVELWSSGLRPTLRAVIQALWSAARTVVGGGLLLLAVATGALAVWIHSSGGTAIGRVSLREPYAPLGYAALAGLLFACWGFWRARDALRPHVAARLSFVWWWLCCPMAAWLLMPGMRRVRVLSQTSFTYESVDRADGALSRLGFYPSAAWRTWFDGEARWLFVALLAATCVLAFRSAAVRRVGVPFGAIAVGQWLTLTVLSSRNFQERFIINLTGVIAVCAGAWLLAVPKPVPAAVLAAAAVLAFGAAAAPQWNRETLAATLTKGFMPVSDGDGCREAARRYVLPSGSTVLNRTGPERYMLCGLWPLLLARERGVQVDVHSEEPGSGEVLVLEDGSEEPLAIDGRPELSEPAVYGPVRCRHFAARP